MDESENQLQHLDEGKRIIDMYYGVGYSDEEITAYLIDSGYSTPLVEWAKLEMQKPLLRTGLQKTHRWLWVGISCVAVALVIGIGGALLAPVGGYYIVPVGLFWFGIFHVFRSANTSSKLEDTLTNLSVEQSIVEFRLR